MSNNDNFLSKEEAEEILRRYLGPSMWIASNFGSLDRYRVKPLDKKAMRQSSQVSTEDLRRYLGVKELGGRYNLDTHLGQLSHYAWLKGEHPAGADFSPIFDAISKVQKKYPAEQERLESISRRLAYLCFLRDEIGYMHKKYDYEEIPINLNQIIRIDYICLKGCSLEGGLYGRGCNMIPDGDYFIVAVSDVHIGHCVFGDDSASEFKKFLTQLEKAEKLKIEHFVILGDFLDLWRDDDDELFKNYGDILDKLGKLKPGKITNLHYVVGNHDFVIPDYKKKGPDDIKRLLEPFQITIPNCVDPASLELETNGQRFILRHGHQDVAEGLALLYDLSAVLLCGQDKEMGDFTSSIYKYKFELATVASIIISLFFLLTNNYLLAGVALAITAIVSVLWFLNYRKHRKASRFLEFLQKPPKEREEDSKIIDAKLEPKLRSWEKVFRSREKPNVVDSGDYRDIQQVLHQRLGRLPELYKAKRDEILNQKPRTLPVKTQDILVRGHTHELIPGKNNEYNPGAWVENYQYCILLINHQGDVNMSNCATATPPGPST